MIFDSVTVGSRKKHNFKESFHKAGKVVMGIFCLFGMKEQSENVYLLFFIGDGGCPVCDEYIAPKFSYD